MSNRFEAISRGRDSSGRTVRATRQAFQHFDRVDQKVSGKLVIVQGAFVTGTAASAGTHDKAGCLDIRTWNLTNDERFVAIREARRLMAAAWYRHPGQNFDPHIHWVLIGDQPMASLAAAQVDMYRKGFNGLGWYEHKDDFPYRPPKITDYAYQEDDMFEKEDRQRLIRIEKELDAFRSGEWKRDQQDRNRFKRAVTALGEQADRLTVLINSTKDDATKADLRKMKAEILTTLKDDPDVTGPDNPSDDAMAEQT